MKYLEGVPVYGDAASARSLSRFRSGELDNDHGKATSKFYDAFERHECGSARDHAVEITEQS
jgi:hypothetical protein